MFQNKAVYFKESVSEACKELGLLSLQDRRKPLRISLLMRILSDEERNNALASAYDEILDNKKLITIRAATRSEPLYNAFTITVSA